MGITASFADMELLFALFLFNYGSFVRGCCDSKTVGNSIYYLVNEQDTSRYGCLNDCIYEKAGEQGSRFCFSAGNLTSTCGPAPMFVKEDDQCNGLWHKFDTVIKARLRMECGLKPSEYQGSDNCLKEVKGFLNSCS